MNLLIGILGNAFDRWQGKSRAQFIRERAAFVCQIRRRPWTVGPRWCWKQCFGRDDGHLFMLSKEGLDPRDFQSMRGVLKSEMITARGEADDKINGIQEQVDQRMGDVEGRMKKIEERLGKLLEPAERD